MLLLLAGCGSTQNDNPVILKTIAPDYTLIELHETTDTLHFGLNNDTYNVLRSFNLFKEKSFNYISFYDKRSQTINIYNLENCSFFKQLPLNRLLRGKQLYKTSVNVRNFDSIFITNKTSLYLLDSAGNIKKSIDFTKEKSFGKANFEPSSIPVLKDNILFTGSKLSLNPSSFDDLRKCKVLYEFDLNSSKTILNYSLPDTYKKNLYGPKFFDYSYCYNNKGNFVFSFSADPNIYETNLADFHISYLGKSRFQATDIHPVDNTELLLKESSKQYALRDSYGAIYFDTYNNRYLRHVKHKISEQDYIAKKKRKESILLLNGDFKIIGESEIMGDLSFESLFITPDGRIYARTKLRDDYALHFVRLEYLENKYKDATIQMNQVNAPH
jgi:hypothetical protein